MILVKSHGFTLIELLVVISIIAILSVIGMVTFTTVQNNARINATKASLDAVYKAIEQQRILQQKVLKDITGSVCTFCSCDFPLEGECLTRFHNTFVTSLKMESIPKDGWGDPIWLNENENEPQSAGDSPCSTKDQIGSGHLTPPFRYIPFYLCPN